MDIKEKLKIRKPHNIIIKLLTLQATVEEANLKPIGIVLSSNLYRILADDVYMVCGCSDFVQYLGLPVRKDVSTSDMVSLEVTTND